MLFDRARWEVDDEVYRLLLPSMRLATNLIMVDIPYIASFLPSDPVHTSLRARYYTKEDEITGLAPPKDYTIPVEDVGLWDLDKAMMELEVMTDCIRWQTNNEMLKQHGWLGITRVVDTPRPWGLIDTDLVVAGDEAHEQDTVRRPLILAICEEYLTAIRNSSPDSEIHLKATFMAGITMAHEVGHAIWHQDYRSYDYRDPNTDIFDNEPWVGDDAIKEELGNAFMGYTFRGFIPEFCRMTPKEHGEPTAPFENALYWKSHPQMTYRARREVYSTGYAIPISYIHKVLSQSFWDGLGNPSVLGFYDNAHAKLQPNTTIQATRNFAEYTVGRDGATWNNTQVDRRPASAVYLQRLTQAELDWQRHWQIAVRTGGPGPAPWRYQVVVRPEIFTAATGIGRQSDGSHDESDIEDYGFDEVTDDDEEFGFISDEKKPGRTQAEKEARRKAHIEIEAQEKALGEDYSDDDHLTTDDGDEFGHDSGNEEWKYREYFPNDGTLVADVQGDSPNPSVSSIIDLEVRYRPDKPANTTKRARPDDDDDEYIGSGTAKRHKLYRNHVEHQVDKYTKIPYDYNDIDALLLNKSPTAIANWFTRRRAIEYCENPGTLGSGLPHNMTAPENNPAWGTSRLDADNPKDRGLIESIRARTFEFAMTRYENPSAQLKLQKALMDSVEHWSRAYMDHFLKVHKLPLHTGSQQTLRHIILAQLQITLDKIKGKVQLTKPKLAHNIPVPVLKKLAVDMADHELAGYFRTWNLPRWGSRLVQEERVIRHREELHEGVADRSGIFRNGKRVIPRVLAGVELYRCEAWDTVTTISQLRDWLFLIAITPAGNEIDLYLGPDREHPLDVDKAFYHYGDLKWDNIWMVLRRYQGEDGLPGGTVMTNPPVFQPTGHDGASGSQGPSQPPPRNSGSGFGLSRALSPGNIVIDLTGDSPGTNSAVIGLTSPSISPSTNPQEVINQLAPIISNTIIPSSSSEEFVNQVAPVIINLIGPSINPQEVITQIGPLLQDLVTASNNPEEAIKLIAAPIINLVSPNSSSVAVIPAPVLPTVNALLASIMARRPTLSSILQPGGGIDPLRPELNGQISRSAFEILDNVEEAEELNETIRGGLLADVIAGGQQLPGAGSNGVPVWSDHTPDELLGDEDFLGAARRVLNQGAPDMGAPGVMKGGFGGGGVGQVLGTGVQVGADEDVGPMPGSFMREVYDRPF